MSGNHHHHHRHDNVRRLGITLALVLVYMAAEVIGGLLSGSLALLADAGHMLADAGALGLALFALRMARKPATAKRTYGYHRTEILAALVNGVTLVTIAVLILMEAWERWQEPREVRGGLMMWVAFGGLLINVAGLWILHGGKSESLNVRGAWLHVATDALGSIQAVVAGGLILWFGWNWADPVASVLIALLVVWSSWSLLKESIDVLMESTPAHLDTDEIRRCLCAVKGVAGVHDLHVWTITSGFESLSAHVRLGAEPRGSELLTEIRCMIQDRFGIEHITVQLEPEDFDDEERHVCD